MKTPIEILTALLGREPTKQELQEYYDNESSADIILQESKGNA